jgi:ubiquitin-protein ligase
VGWLKHRLSELTFAPQRDIGFMSTLQKQEKVLVQYRLLKDFDELSRRGIPGIDVRVMEDNIYEWHVTMRPLSGHFSGLRLHLILLFPEDYPRQPPKVELCTYLPHANVFRDFLTFSGFFAGYEPVRGTYVICTDLLEVKPLPQDASDSKRYDGWSVAYSVESVLVQLQCLLFDDYVQSEDGHYVNTLWDHWYSRPGEGRKTRLQVCDELHRAQKEADEFFCPACGFAGHEYAADDVCKKVEPNVREAVDNDLADDEEDSDNSESPVENAQDQLAEIELSSSASTCTNATDVEATKPKFVSRKKQRKLASAKQALGQNLKVDFKKQTLYMEISNSNSAITHGCFLRRVPGVFKPGDVVSFFFHGVKDDAYVNGRMSINQDLEILNYGHEVEFPWCAYDIMLGRTIYRKTKPNDEDEKKKENRGKSDWKKFVNSQGGGSSKLPADTPGTLEYVKKTREVLSRRCS